jgi:hypothetical protein
MRVRSPTIDWAMDERRRLLEEIAILPSSIEANVQTTAALTYLRDRLGRLNILIAALERNSA